MAADLNAHSVNKAAEFEQEDDADERSVVVEDVMNQEEIEKERKGKGKRKMKEVEEREVGDEDEQREEDNGEAVDTKEVDDKGAEGKKEAEVNANVKSGTRKTGRKKGGLESKKRKKRALSSNANNVSSSEKTPKDEEGEGKGKEIVMNVDGNEGDNRDASSMDAQENPKELKKVKVEGDVGGTSAAYANNALNSGKDLNNLEDKEEDDAKEVPKIDSLETGEASKETQSHTVGDNANSASSSGKNRNDEEKKKEDKKKKVRTVGSPATRKTLRDKQTKRTAKRTAEAAPDAGNEKGPNHSSSLARKSDTSSGSRLKDGMGLIFFCNSKTKKDCFNYKVFGMQSHKKELVASIHKGMRLFLYDIDLKLMYGIYQAAGKGGFDIERKAFNSAFPAQVRFAVFKDCNPLPEEKFKAAIRENYTGRNKFKIELTSKQVKNLSSLFLSYTSKSKHREMTLGREAHGSANGSRHRRSPGGYSNMRQARPTFARLERSPVRESALVLNRPPIIPLPRTERISTRSREERPPAINREVHRLPGRTHVYEGTSHLLEPVSYGRDRIERSPVLIGERDNHRFHRERPIYETQERVPLPASYQRVDTNPTLIGGNAYQSLQHAMRPSSYSLELDIRQRELELELREQRLLSLEHRAREVLDKRSPLEQQTQLREIPHYMDPYLDRDSSAVTRDYSLLRARSVLGNRSPLEQHRQPPEVQHYGDRYVDRDTSAGLRDYSRLRY